MSIVTQLEHRAGYVAVGECRIHTTAYVLICQFRGENSISLDIIANIRYVDFFYRSCSVHSLYASHFDIRVGWSIWSWRFCCTSTGLNTVSIWKIVVPLSVMCQGASPVFKRKMLRKLKGHHSLESNRLSGEWEEIKPCQISVRAVTLLPGQFTCLGLRPQELREFV